MAAEPTLESRWALAAPAELAWPAERRGKKLQGADSSGPLVPGAELAQWEVSAAERPGGRARKESASVWAAERLEERPAEEAEPEQPVQA